MALIKGLESFYLFDPHTRNIDGMPDPNGTAVVIKYNDILELEQYLCSLSTELNTNLFEIVPVQLCIDSKHLQEPKIRLEKDRMYRKRKQAEESPCERQSRLDDNKSQQRKQADESLCQRQTRLDNKKKSQQRKQADESLCQRQTRLDNKKKSQQRKRSQETESDKHTRLEKATMYKKRKRAEKACIHNVKLSQAEKIANQQDYLKEFDITYGGIENQCWAKSNINKFHKSVEFFTSQCTVCQEAWPLKSKPRSPNDYVYSRCSRDKKSPKKFSCENSMIPSCVPHELQGLTEVEEMLIAHALPIMRVYIKPGGQRGYSGHCINLPQNVKELATSLPRYLKDLAVIIVKLKGKHNTFKDVNVRRDKVRKALLWLIHNNPHYAQLEIDEEALNSLPENGVPPDLMNVETKSEIVSDDTGMPDLGPPTDNPSEDTVYTDSTDMSSFLPVGEQQQQEIEAVRNQLFENDPMTWPTIEIEPLNEYQVSHLATMAFPSFPDGKGDPTNQGLLRDVAPQERIKHLEIC